MAPSARMIYSQAAGVNQLCYAVFYLVPIAGVCCFLAQVWWLRKALLHLEVSRQLPVEYGTVSTISVLGFLIFFREGQYVTAEQGAAIAGGIALIVLGCGLIGSRRTPVPQLHCWLRVRRLGIGEVRVGQPLPIRPRRRRRRRCRAVARWERSTRLSESVAVCESVRQM